MHETLSREAGDVVRVQRDRAAAGAARRGDRVVAGASRSGFSVEGDAGELPGEVATPLAVVLNELMQNAVDHAFPKAWPKARGRRARSRATTATSTIEVRDDGAGLPEQFTLEGSRGLGLSIVQALVTSELQGSIEMHDDNGTLGPRAASRSRCRESSCTFDAGVELADWRRRASTPLRSAAALLFGEAAPDAGLLVGGQRELEALGGDRALRRRRAWRASIWSSATPVVPIGKNSSGLVSRQAARSRHSSASQSWVRIQVNATLFPPREMFARRPHTPRPAQK